MAKPSPGPTPHPSTEADLRLDPLTQASVVVARGRQGRPNLPRTGCPFCPGGLEAPEMYEVRWFKNRWPPLPADRCEVVLFSPDHGQSLATLSPGQLERVVSLWAERTRALGTREDVAYVLVFENRGEDVGATIPHPHGQIYAFADVPPVPRAELVRAHCALCEELAGKGCSGSSHRRRLVVTDGGWEAWTAWAASYPFELIVAPEGHLGDLPQASPSHPGLARVLKGALGALDALFGEPMPYMMWCHQRPTDGGAWPAAHVHFHIAPTRRDKGVARYVASGELGSGVMFNPVDPVEAAARLKKARPPREKHRASDEHGL